MPLSQNFYRQTRRELGEKLEPESLAIIYSGRAVQQSLDADYPFYTDNNFYYLTGIEEPDVTLLMKKDAGGEVSECLFIDEPDPFKEKWVGAKISIEEAQALSGIKDVRYNTELESFILQETRFDNLYFDFTMPKHQSFATSDPQIKLLFADMELQNLQPYLTAMRLIKKPEEVQALRDAIEITAKGIDAILENLKPDMKEYQIQAVFEYTINMMGAQGVSFQTIAASGKSATVLHYIKNQATMKGSDMVLLDLGARYKGYCGDISRTFPVSGTYTDEQATVYNMVLEAQRELIQMYQPGAKMLDIQQATKDIFLEKCLKNNIVPKNKDINEFYYHGIGHSLGLDTHDTNDKREYILEPGMVITCEPGLYIAEMGMGVRIEDDILVTENGPENLSPQIPKDIDVIEKRMKG